MAFSLRGRMRSTEGGTGEVSKEMTDKVNNILERMAPLFNNEEYMDMALKEKREHEKAEISRLESGLAARSNMKIEDLEKEEKATSSKFERFDKDLNSLEAIKQIYYEKSDLTDENEKLKKELKEAQEKAAEAKKNTAAGSGQDAAAADKKVEGIEKYLLEKDKEIKANDDKILKAQLAISRQYGELNSSTVYSSDEWSDKVFGAMDDAKSKKETEEKALTEIKNSIDILKNNPRKIAEGQRSLRELEDMAANPDAMIRQSIVSGIEEAAKILESRNVLSINDEQNAMDSLVKDSIFEKAKSEIEKLNKDIGLLEEDKKLAEKQGKKVEHELAVDMGERFKGRVGRGARERGLNVKASSDIANERLAAAKEIINSVLMHAKTGMGLGQVLMLVSANGDESRLARSNIDKKEITPYVNAINEYTKVGAKDRVEKLIAAIRKADTHSKEGSGNAGDTGVSGASITTTTPKEAFSYENAVWTDDAARERFITENGHVIKAFGYAKNAYNNLDKSLRDAFESGTLSAAQAVVIYKALSKAWANEQRGVFKGAAKDYLLTDNEIDSASVESIDYSHSKALIGHMKKLDHNGIDAYKESEIRTEMNRIRENHPLLKALRTEGKKASMPPESPEVTEGEGEANMPIHPAAPLLRGAGELGAMSSDVQQKKENENTSGKNGEASATADRKRRNEKINAKEYDAMSEEARKSMDEGIKELITSGVTDALMISKTLNLSVMVVRRRMAEMVSSGELHLDFFPDSMVESK